MKIDMKIDLRFDSFQNDLNILNQLSYQFIFSNYPIFNGNNKKNWKCSKKFDSCAKQFRILWITRNFSRSKRSFFKIANSPCVLILTGKNLFSLQGTPFLIAGNPCSHCREPVFITGIYLWELVHREIPVVITGNGFAVYRNIFGNFHLWYVEKSLVKS